MVGRFKFSSEKNCELITNKRFAFSLRYCLFFPRRDVAYSFIPKNACTTLRFILAKDNGFIDSLEQLDWIHENNLTLRCSLTDSIKAKSSFIVLRDPIDRLVSCFLDKFIDEKPESEKLLLANGLSDLERSQLTFNEFVRILQTKENLNLDAHWTPQFRFQLYKSYTHYFDFSDIQRCFEWLASKGVDVVDTREYSGHASSLLKNDPSLGADTPIVDLKVAKSEGFVPERKNLVNSKTEKVLKNLYAKDYQLRMHKLNNATN